MNGFKTLIYQKKDHIGFIILNRPEALNAYCIQMRDDLFETLGAIMDDDEVRVVILKGAGPKAFCAGADLSEFLTAPPPVAARKVRFKRDIWGRFLNMPQPFIAALHGYVLGSGIEMALYCDIRIASPDTKFGLPEIGLGIIPAAGGTQTLPRIIGRSRALEMLLTNRWIDADEALRFQLVNSIVPMEELYKTTEAMAEKIASFDPLVVRYAKQAVTRGLDMTLMEGLELENILSSNLRKKPRQREEEAESI